jgi:hypothetical protein
MMVFRRDLYIHDQKLAKCLGFALQHVLLISSTFCLL